MYGQEAQNSPPANVVPTSAPAAVPPPPPVVEEQKEQEGQKEVEQPIVEENLPPMSDAPIYSAASPVPFGQSIVSREEKVEYRDQNGNILDPEEVKALEGKVSFKTRYETRTRLVDGSGNVVDQENAGVAPPHPEDDNVDPETVPVLEPEIQEAPASQNEVEEDVVKEEVVETVVVPEPEIQEAPASQSEAEEDEAKEESIDNDHSGEGEAKPASDI